ncbi:MAG: DUF262 domain-containing protein [Hungatella sp.]|nr:DUF262 domain-containing protein [Hungatella sp.]
MSEGKMAEYLEGIRVQQYKSDIGFRTLVESVNDNMYIIPKYQRKYRWGKNQVIGLVESLLKGFPIPPIYTCRNDRNQLEILDGQQRVMSLFFYYIGYFLNKRKESAIDFSDLEVGELSFADAMRKHFPLEELHVQIKDMDVDYAALPVEVKRRVDYTTITVIEIKVGKEERKDEILQAIFANLNRNGALLSKQEQRNGIFNCGLYDMLHEFNKKNKKWRKLWGREDSKGRDLETLLRFCALRTYVSCTRGGKAKGFEFKIAGYYTSYGEMLDHFSKEAMSFPCNAISEYRRSLEEFVDLFEINTVLSSKVALMEGFYVIFERVGIKKKITKVLLDSVQSAAGYRENSGQRTVNIRKMNGRWNTVYEYWDRVSQ